MEKLGHDKHSQLPITSLVLPHDALQLPGAAHHTGSTKDLKSFVIDKNPSSDMQFAAVIAYYYKFEAPINERKDSINSEVLQNATRLAGRTRLTKPVQTLVNTSFNGLLDKADEKGSYKINTVGENLVAMTLPQSAKSNSSNPKQRNRKSQPKKIKKTSRNKKT